MPMQQKRKDADYLRHRISVLYRDHTAKETATLLNSDPQVVAPVTERIVYNTLNKLRQQREEDEETAICYKDKPWTEEDDACLRQWYAHGASIPMIANQVRRSAPSVHGRIRSLKLKNRKITPEQVQAIIDLIHYSNKSLKVISYELGLKYQAVRHVSDKLKKALGTVERHTSDISFWEDGSLAERLIRDALVAEYGSAIIPWQHNREWSQGRGWQIDIPIEFSSKLKIAIEINHIRTHADRRNRDYAKRHLAEKLGWVWVPIWFGDDELTKESVAYALDTINRIIDDLKRGDKEFYKFYMSLIEELEKQYYFPEQPPYDPKEGVKFGESWSAKDTDVVADHYGKVPVEELQTMLSTPRTRDAIMHKARHLGLTRRTKNFSSEEDNIIRGVYPDGTDEEILEKLPGRSLQSVANRATRLGVKRRSVWTSEEEAVLVEHYPCATDEELVRILTGRTVDSIRTRANRLGLKKGSMWTSEEDDRLRLVYPEDPRTVIELTLPHRSWSAIISRASKLGIRRTKSF